MRCSTISFLIVLLFAGTTGIAQIEKHSFGAGVSNGILYIPGTEFFASSSGEPSTVSPAVTPYMFGAHGSHVNSLSKWLALRTSLGGMVTSRYEDFPEEFDEYVIRYNRRNIFANIGFGPMLTFQQKDFGIYLGGTFELLYSFEHRRNINHPETSMWRNLNYPFPTASGFFGYWQRMGNVNSPLYLEIVLERRQIPGILTFFSNYPVSYLYNLTVGFRYEFK
ncbi:MAG: hypothetical protein JJU02_15490 [Cryomorphaceae bacterium]|nr:hypothetical protein [Cryomorphaceae bacterium]